MNIGIDIDDTINNISEIIMPYAQMWNISHGNPIGPVNPTARHNHEIYCWSLDEMRAFKKEWINELAPQAALKPLVREVLSAFRQNGDKIYFITARNRDWDMYIDPYKITADYLAKHNIEYDGLIAECLDKVAACKEYKIDVLIEDTLNTSKKAIAAGIRSILVAAPHNKDCGNIERAHSWAEIYYILKGDLWKN